MPKQPKIDKGRRLSPEEIDRLRDQYQPPLTNEEMLEKKSIPRPDTSHWDSITRGRK